MKLKDLNGQIHRKNLSDYKKTGNSRSKGQQKLGEIISEIWPNIPVYEEVPCIGTKLKLDFLIESLRIAFEFDGSQHSEYNSFFHGDRYEFAKSVIRDTTKEKWCSINDIILIHVTEDDLDIDKIRAMINERISK